MNAFETNLTADWKKKEDEEKGEVEKKEEESDNSGGGRVREWDDFIFIFVLLFWIDMCSNVADIFLATRETRFHIFLLFWIDM